MSRKIFKPKIPEGREYERWLLDVTNNANDSGIELFAYSEVATSYAMKVIDSTIGVTASGVTITLPADATIGKTYTIDNQSTGNITVVGAIEGETSQTVPPDSCMQVYYTGTKWRIK